MHKVQLAAQRRLKSIWQLVTLGSHLGFLARADVFLLASDWMLLTVKTFAAFERRTHKSALPPTAHFPLA